MTHKNMYTLVYITFKATHFRNSVLEVVMVAIDEPHHVFAGWRGALGEEEARATTSSRGR